MTFQILKELLDSKEWPEAVSPFMICEDTEEDKLERADGILDWIGRDLKDKKVLDFGCGQGHVSFQASKQASKSVGYDIVESGELLWEADDSNLLITTNFQNIIKYGPYDVIILYDVLDHCENVEEVLEQIKIVCSESTQVIVRCHSWMSRHGSHLYRQLNKAWIHLFFTEEELQKMDLTMDFTRKYYFPLDTHKLWFKNARLTIKSSDIEKEFVESFFKKQEFKSRIPKEFKDQFPEWQMSQSFNDYVLTVK